MGGGVWYSLFIKNLAHYSSDGCLETSRLRSFAKINPREIEKILCSLLM